MAKLYFLNLKGANSIEKLLHLGNLHEENFRISDTKLDSKIYHTWKMAGLVEMVGKGKWAKFTFFELLWLMTLETMRKFGCSVKLMKVVYDELFEKAKRDKLGEKTIKENFDYYKKLSKERTLTKNEEEISVETERVLNDKMLLYSLNTEISYFSQLVFHCITQNEEVGLIIFEDQTITTYKGWEEMNLHRTRPHILIPISSFIKDFIADEEKDQFLLPAGLLSDEDNKIRKLINDRNVESILIHRNDGNDPLVYKCDPSGIIPEEHSVEIMQILSLKKYASIELHTREGYRHTFSYRNPFNNQK